MRPMLMGKQEGYVAELGVVALLTLLCVVQYSLGDGFPNEALPEELAQQR